jgi:hypothetical protein
MAEQLRTAPIGVMYCAAGTAKHAGCGAVIGLFHTDLAAVASEGKVWRYCPGCRERTWFVPFDPMPTPEHVPHSATDPTHGGVR